MSTIARAWCDCGFHGEYSSESRAAYAMRRHDCDRWRRKRTKAKQRAARAATFDRTERPCLHKIAHHEHGSYARFTLDHCHCDPCRAAKTEYEAQRRRRKAYGEEFYVDARPATAHVRTLMAAGMGWKRVAAAAGLDASVVYPLLYGRPDRNGGAVRTKARRETVQAILALPVPTIDDLAGPVSVDPTGTRRRVQALACLGWSVDRLAARSGVDRQAIDRALRGARVSVTTARAIRVAYDELWNTPAPEGDQRQRIAAARSRNRAARLGWVPPLAWDDDSIDDPTAVPDVGEKARHGVDLDEWVHLVTSGETAARAAQRVDVTLNTIEVAAVRNDRTDVLALIRQTRATRKAA